MSCPPPPSARTGQLRRPPGMRQRSPWPDRSPAEASLGDRTTRPACSVASHLRNGGGDGPSVGQRGIGVSSTWTWLLRRAQIGTFAAGRGHLALPLRVSPSELNSIPRSTVGHDGRHTARHMTPPVRCRQSGGWSWPRARCELRSTITAAPVPGSVRWSSRSVTAGGDPRPAPNGTPGECSSTSSVSTTCCCSALSAPSRNGPRTTRWLVGR